MSIKNNYNYLFIFLFVLFFFFWVNFSWDFIWSSIDVKKYSFLFNFSEGYIKFRPSYLIIFLIIPIFLNSSKKIYKGQNKIITFVLLVVIHFFFIKYFFNEEIVKSELANILYLIILSIIYCEYRNFIEKNFKNIIFIFLLTLIFFSFIDNTKEYNFGQCQSDFFLIHLLKNYLKIVLTNGIYSENSHLAMMMVPVLFSSLVILKESFDKKIIFIASYILSLVILFNNLSTTYFVVYFFSLGFVLIFFFKKIDKNFWIFSILILVLNSFIFFSDKHCSAKITDFNTKDVLEKNLNKTSNDKKNNKNTTTLVYERSIIITFDTLKNRPFGWGIDGMDNATINLINKPKYNDAYILVKQLNFKDGLSNFFKMFTEFGILSLLIFYFFIKYTLNIKTLNSYNIFIIVLFITMCIRGAGYFNGGFIFCIFEFLYFNKVNDKLKIS